MRDIVKNIENKEQTKGPNIPKNFDIEIEKSFQEFLKSNEFKKLENNSTKQTIQDKFNTRLKTNLDKLDELKNLKIDETIQNTNFELIWFETKIWLAWLYNNINVLNTKDSPDEGLLNIISKIDWETDQKLEESKSIKELLKERKFWEAIKSIFNVLKELIFWKWWKPWLEDYKDLDKYLGGLDQKNKNEILDMISNIENKIDNTKDIRKKMRYTYTLSRLKDNLIKKDEWTTDKKEILSKKLKEGDILLINKENKEYKSSSAKWWDKFLSAFNKIHYPKNFLHSVVVTKVEWDEIYITHSTLQRKNWKSWIEEIALNDLLNWYKASDILAMTMPNDNKEKMLSYVKQKLNEQNNKPNESLYDDKIAQNNLTWYGTPNEKKVNCVELITEGLWEEKLKWVWIPNDLLSSNILKPTYLTTI